MGKIVPLANLSVHPTLKKAKAGRNITTVGFGDMYHQPIAKGDFAVVAFNLRNFPLPKEGGYEEGYVGPSTATPVLRAARDLEAPVILEIAGSELGKEGSPYTGVISRNGMERGLELFVQHIFAEYERLDMSGIPLGIHYDHGTKIDVMRAAIKAGFTSVAMDGGDQTSWGALVKKASTWVNECHPLGVGVEGEIELVDKEDPTKPAEAIKFAKATGVDVLVVTLSKNVHGALPGESKMESDRLQAVRDALPDMPLNLHGGSGFALEDLTRASMSGLIQKLNYATVVYEAMMKSVPGWQAVLNMVSGNSQGTRPKAGRKQLALTDPLLSLMTKEVVEAAEEAAYVKAVAVMKAVGNRGTAQYYSG